MDIKNKPRNIILYVISLTAVYVLELLAIKEITEIPSHPV